MRLRVTLQLPARPVRDVGTALDGATALLIGHGYVARALDPALRRAGVVVRHTVRDADTALGPDAVPFGSDAMRAAFEAADLVLVSVPPARGGSDPALLALHGARSRARWIGYLSATSVYGDRAGGWAFEGEAPTPGLARGVRRAEAELAWLEAHPQTQIFRLAGIYGPGRAPFERLRAGTARIIDAPGHVVNRIHVDDIVSALLASVARPSPQDIYNIADGHPAPPGEVLRHAAALIGLDPPPVVALDSPNVSVMARSFYAETKRIDTARIRERLGWVPRHPTYGSGLRAVLEAERSASEPS
ncbi:MAG: SDR family NAD(P)-dependent oxidoreductase [Pseudomonadota bacterium]